MDPDPSVSHLCDVGPVTNGDSQNKRYETPSESNFPRNALVAGVSSRYQTFNKKSLLEVSRRSANSHQVFGQLVLSRHMAGMGPYILRGDDVGKQDRELPADRG